MRNGRVLILVVLFVITFLAWNYQETANFQQSSFMVIVRATDDLTYYSVFTNSSFTGVTELPGFARDTLGAVQCGGRLYLAKLGTDNNTYFGSVNITTNAFSGWTQLPNYTLSSPGLAADSSCNLYLALRGTDNGIYLSTYMNGSCKRWIHLPGATKASPAVAVTATTIYIAVRGIDDGTYFGRITRSSMAFQGWVNVGGATYNKPSLTAVSDSEIYMAVSGTDNAVYLNRWNGVAWAGWTDPVMGTVVSLSGPGLIVSGGRLYVMIRGADNYLYVASGKWGGSWTMWGKLGVGSQASSPTLA